MPLANDRPKKLQRISQACDLCHRRSIRCRPSTENPHQQCQNCYDFAVDCTYKRPSRRRRHQSLALNAPLNILSSQQHVHHVHSHPARVVSPHSDESLQEYAQQGRHASIVTLPDSVYGPAAAFGAVRSERQSSRDGVGVAWRSFVLASANMIEQYLEIYLDVLYPSYPLFHPPTLWERIHQQRHLTDRGFFASVMAACALAAARARDSALREKYNISDEMQKSSEVFFVAAQDSLPHDLATAHGFEYMRTCALLALTSIQLGQIQRMHEFLGHYTTLSAMHAFHDETQWPLNITIVEREERRRLFWSVYTLDIFAAVLFNSVLRSQETRSNVRYPSQVTDDDLLSGIATPSHEDNWLRGWNFNIDLYRVLEHAVRMMRNNVHCRDDKIAIVRMLIADGVPQVQVMDQVLGLYCQLPPCFREYGAQVTGDTAKDMIGFQAASIQTTLQVVRMVLFTSTLSYDLRQECDMAERILSTFRNISKTHLRAMGTPLVYYLGRIGQFLASLMEGLLCEETYSRVRNSLVSVADLLAELESGQQMDTGAGSDGLRRQIEKIDHFMRAQRHVVGVPPGVPLTSNGAPVGVSGINGVNGAMGHGAEYVLEHRPSQHQSTLPLPASAPAVGQPPSSVAAALGIHSPLDEFQLPQDLVNHGAWPWPLEMASGTSPHQVSGSMAMP